MMGHENPSADTTVSHYFFAEHENAGTNKEHMLCTDAMGAESPGNAPRKRIAVG
jgi:hypothetical protein